MHRTHHLLPWLAILLSVLLWGFSFISTKVVLRELPPASVALFRMLPALLVLVPMLVRRGGSLLPARHDWPRFTAAALFGIVLYMVLENSGLQYTSASTASMLVASIPVFVLFIESLVTRTRIRKRELACILVSLGGVWLVLFDGRWPDLSQSGFLGNALVLGAMAAWIVYTFIARRLGQGYSGLQQTTLQSVLAVFLFLPFALPESPRWTLPSPVALANLVFLGIFCSGFAFVAYLFALKELGTVVPSAFLNLIPVVTIATAFLALGEVPGLFQITGAAAIIAALSTLSLTRERTAPASGA